MMMSPLLIDEPPLHVLPTLAVKIGLNEAIVLQQVHYHLNPRHNKTVIDNRRWVNHTYQEWQKQFPFWSLKTIQRVLYHLEEMGLLITYVSKEFQKAKFYSLNYDALLQLSTSDFAISGSREDEKRSESSVRSDCPDRTGQLVQHAGQVVQKTGQNDQIDQVNLTSSLKKNNNYIYNNIYTLPPHQRTLLSSAQEDDEVALQMIQIWNDVLDDSLLPSSSAARKQNLISVFRDAFQSSLSEWQQFCEKVARTPFLRGAGPNQWQASLEWCLRDGRIASILEGKYDLCLGQKAVVTENITSTVPSVHQADLADQLHAEIAAEPDSRLRSFKQHLLQAYGQHIYRHWFRGLKIVAWQLDKLTLQAPNALVGNRCRERYHVDLLKAAEKVFKGVRTLEVIQPASKEVQQTGENCYQASKTATVSSTHPSKKKQGTLPQEDCTMNLP